MTNSQLQRFQFILSILAILAFWIGYTVGRTNKMNRYDKEQMMSAISTAADSAIHMKNSGADDRSSKESAEESGRRTLSTDRDKFIHRVEE